MGACTLVIYFYIHVWTYVDVFVTHVLVSILHFLITGKLNYEIKFDSRF